MKLNLKAFIKGGVMASSLCLIPAAGFAGGAFSTTPSGTPVLWSGNVTWRAETGPIKGGADDGGGGGGGGGCQLTKSLDIPNSQALDIVRAAFAAWDSVPNASINIVEGSSLGTDVNFDNIENFWVGTFFGGTVGSTVTAEPCYSGNGDCLNSVIFDSSNAPERSIVDAIQGECARYSLLAFAAILPQQNNDPPQFTISSPQLKSSQMVISGACVAPVIAPDPSCVGNPNFASQCPAGGISLEELQGTVTHEVGHYLGLDHTLANKQNYINCATGVGACELEDIPTMIGLFVPGANLNTLHYDDQVTFARYYPASTQDVPGGKVIPGTCTIKGKVTQSDNVTPLRCEEVVARLNNDPSTAASFISGAEVRRFTQGAIGVGGTGGKNQSNCNPDAGQTCGDYEIRGLTPGSYHLGTHDFKGGGNLASFVLEPCTPAIANDTQLDNDDQVTVNCVANTVHNHDLKSN